MALYMDGRVGFEASASQESTVESHEVLTLRAMAWERAKGELRAMLATYWPNPTEGDTARAEMEERVRDFIANVEENM